MTRSKLSASDREELIRLFKETTETITSLANQFQVSVSTARRVLKTQLSAEEYETIVTSRLEGRQNKRNDSGSKSSPTVAPPSSQDEVETEDKAEGSGSAPEKAKVAPPIRRPKRRSRRRSSAEDAAENSITAELEELDSPPSPDSPVELDTPVDSSETSSVPRPRKKQPQATLEAEAKDSTSMVLEVHPIEVAEFPNQCYLVVDRASELITPPLREFSELGSIPNSEESAKTLPIFENHKIASRFSRRSQRIIKIPNSDILKKTYSLLNAKGVERILFDGQVFSLTNHQS